MSSFRLGPVLMSVFVFCFLTAATFAQDADKGAASLYTKPEPSEQPKSVREIMVKMQIEESKKQYDEMLDRGQQALKISEDLEHTFSDHKSLTRTDLEKLDNLEKLVKKIRGELGGQDGDGSTENIDNKEESPPTNIADGFKFLQSQTTKLVDELKKTSRFGISAVAIESSNAVLKVVKFLRFSRQN